MDNPTLFFRRRRAKDSSATSVAVIGLGRFGGALATELVRSGTEVLGIDTDEDVVQSLNGVLTHVVRADSTKEVALEQLGVTQFDRVVVGIGSDIQASILTTSLLKRMGVRSIWAKAISEQHGLILEQLGIEHVIFPEADMGRRVAHLVRGEYDAADGSRRSYSAEDADLVEWVHLAFTDAFLVAHTTWGGAIPGGPDAYVSEWATAGRLMGVTRPPVSVSDLHARMDGLLAAGTLCGGERVDDVVRFLRTVPLEGSLRFGYRILFEGAVATIPREYRRLLGLRRSWLPAVTATRLVLFVAQRALGTGPRAHDMARRRLRRLEAAECQRPAS